jgi:hypothetical protein
MSMEEHQSNWNFHFILFLVYLPLHALPSTWNYYNRYMLIFVMLIKTILKVWRRLNLNWKTLSLRIFGKIDLPSFRKKILKNGVLGKITKLWVATFKVIYYIPILIFFTVLQESSHYLLLVWKSTIGISLKFTLTFNSDIYCTYS